MVMTVPLVWLLSTIMGYTLIFVMFDLQHMRPWMKRAGIVLSVVALTVRIIRNEMGDTQMFRIWNNMQLERTFFLSCGFRRLSVA